jgi:2-amino-4-hydroxy-6-hydroxymethyldihydropteridine diphosphokinase
MKLYIGLGANLGSREENIEKAIRLLDGKIGTFLKKSSLYETKPVGFSSSNLFLNAVAVFETQISDPVVLLDITQETERAMGRRRSSYKAYRDRSIDIDILLLDGILVQTPDVTIPHPRIKERRFVLDPLLEVAPDLKDPDTGQSYRELYAHLNRLDIQELKIPSLRAAHVINHLLHQLSPKAPTMDVNYLRRTLTPRTTHIYIGYDEAGYPAAMVTLCLAASPSGCKAWMEDLVVDEEYRHRGYAHALVAYIKEESRRLGASTLNFTSRPERKEANRLYQAAGFQPRNTHVYRWEVD